MKTQPNTWFVNGEAEHLTDNERRSRCTTLLIGPSNSASAAQIASELFRRQIDQARLCKLEVFPVRNQMITEAGSEPIENFLRELAGRQLGGIRFQEIAMTPSSDEPVIDGSDWSRLAEAFENNCRNSGFYVAQRDSEAVLVRSKDTYGAALLFMRQEGREAASTFLHEAPMVCCLQA